MVMRWKYIDNDRWCVAHSNGDFPEWGDKAFPRWVWRFWDKVNASSGWKRF